MEADGLFSPLVEQAIELSAQWHDRTYRKGRWREAPFEPPTPEVLRVPVMAHVTVVALTVQRGGWDEAAVAAAFLHDVLEDANQYGQAMRYEDLCALMGEEVARYVRDVTERKYDALGNPRGWEDRKRDYVQRLHEASVQAVAISLSDKLHNLWSINESLAGGIDVFTPGPYRRALSAGPPAQRWFHYAVFEVAEQHDEARLEPLRARLRGELLRFDRLTDQERE